MKRLVVTRSDHRVQQTADITHPIIKKFCTQWNADFEVLSHDLDIPSYGKTHYRLLGLHERFPEYDRICTLDTDMIIMPSCPDPFDEVPEDCIGTVLEDVGHRVDDCHRQRAAIQSVYGDIGWREGWINTGMFVTSRMHANIFQPFEGKVWPDNDDPHFMYLIKLYKHKIHELNFKWNHMSLYSEAWNNHADRFDSYIIHYAGQARFPGHVGNNSNEDKLRLLKQDYEKVYG